VLEIRSEDDRWKDIIQKVGEYLVANVLTVVVIDPVSQRVHVYSADNKAMILNSTDTLTFPDLLPGFEIITEQLFE
jgi:Uma2 family endonuclease